MGKTDAGKIDLCTGTGRKSFFESFFGLILDPPPVGMLLQRKGIHFSFLAMGLDSEPFLKLIGRANSTQGPILIGGTSGKDHWKSRTHIRGVFLVVVMLHGL